MHSSSASCYVISWEECPRVDLFLRWWEVNKLKLTDAFLVTEIDTTLVTSTAHQCVVRLAADCCLSQPCRRRLPAAAAADAAAQHPGDKGGATVTALGTPAPASYRPAPRVPAAAADPVAMRASLPSSV